MSRALPIALALPLLAGCSRTGLDLGPSPDSLPPPDSLADAATLDAGCVAAPEPTVLVNLTNPATPGGPSYAFTGDASRLYTFVFGSDPAQYRILSIDPCTGENVVLGSSTYSSPLATDGQGVYFLSYTSDTTVDLTRSDPLGQSLTTAANLGADYVFTLTLFGGRGYAVNQAFSLVTLALDGSGPVPLFPGLPNDMIRVWWLGSAADDSFVYFYGDDGLEKVPIGGGATTTLFADGGDSACGGSEAAAVSRVLVDDTNVYLGGANGILSVGKDGSHRGLVPGTAGVSLDCGPIAIDDTYIYFASAAGLERIPKTGGTATLLASDEDYGGIVVTSSSIYWLDYTRAVMKLDKP